MRHRLARVAAAVSTAVAACALPLISPPPAHAQTASRSGPCLTADADAVTVVIDFQDLGGGTRQYCVSGLPAGTTGIAALQATGVGVQGTATSGLSFVCRIGSKPGASQSLALPNGQSYVETCANTPPATAYWSYWYASQGGQWTYTSQGASARQVSFGGYEGWSFSLGASFGHAPAPRLTPAAWASPPQPTPTAPVTTVTPHPTATQPPTNPPKTTPAATGSKPTAAPTTATQTAPGSPAPPPATSSPASTAPATPTSDPPATDDADPATGGSFPWATAAGIGLIAAVAVVSGGAVWLRRRERSAK